MQGIQYIYAYLVALGTFLVVDLLWLGVFAKSFYRTQLGQFMGDVQWIPALLFYFMYIGGILIFAVIPALDAHSLVRAIVLGGLLGLLAYATYDLTNLATIRDWPLIVTVVDLIWGTILTASISAVTYYIVTKFIL